MARPMKYSQEMRERAVRMAAEAMARGDYASGFTAIRSIARKLEDPFIGKRAAMGPSRRG